MERTERLIGDEKVDRGVERPVTKSRDNEVNRRGYSKKSKRIQEQEVD